jgi:heat shock protein HspQ
VISSCKFAPGQIVLIPSAGLRGVIVEVDEFFRGTEDSMIDLCRGRGPKRGPWYHVMIEKGDIVYVSERQMAADSSGRPISHPMVSEIFPEFVDGRYRRLNH